MKAEKYKKLPLKSKTDATLYCPQCGSNLEPVERLITKITPSERFRRFECSNKYCDHKEAVRCSGHNLERQQDKIKEANKHDKMTRGRNIY
jgi:formate dehydrogenase maturation protein FdhE